MEEILRAGLWAPTGCNRQTIEYLALYNKDDIRYCKLIAGEGHSFPDDAAIAIIILVDPRSYSLPSQRHMAYLEAGAAIQNILLTAHCFGIGSCWLFWDGRKVNHYEFNKKFNLNSWLLPVSMVCFGYPEIVPKFRPERKNIKTAVHHFPSVPL
jgi:nitroreductase